MKISFKYMGILTLVATVAACKKDNYTAPSVILSGHVVYKGNALQLERNQVPLQIYQYGFGKVGPIGETFAQDGSYSAVLFNGNYKIIVPNGQGPFLWKQTSTGNPDTVNVTVTGNQTLDLEATPYFMITNLQFAAASGVVTASFSTSQIITDANAKNIERVSLYINKTQYTSGGDNIAKTDSIGGAAAIPGTSVTLQVTIPTALIIPAQNYVYARIGLKIVGLEDLIYTPVQKVSF